MSSKTNNPKSPDDEDQAGLDPLFLAGMTPVTPPLHRHKVIASRLEERIARSIAEHAGLLTIRLNDGRWQNLKDGVRFKSLWKGSEGSSVLIELAPGAALPVHRHLHPEEGIVLRGSLQIGDLELETFDYHRSPAGSRHDRIRSRQGALAFLRGTSIGDTRALFRELFSGMLPFRGSSAQTVFSGQGWAQVEPGVLKKDLCSDDAFTSRFYRLEPGARIAGYHHSQNEECIILSGEVFLGDVLLRAGEYQVAPAGSRQGEVFTDAGALFFVRGADNREQD